MTDREQKIHLRLKQDYEYVKSLGYNVFGVFVQGSQNYKMDYEGSDIDTKCIVLPSIEDVVLHRPPASTTIVFKDNSHIDIKDIRLMWTCFRKQNINYFEILFTEFYFIPEAYQSYWNEMVSFREDIAHFDNYAAVNCIVGMVLEKQAALCHPYPTLKEKIDKYGYDHKQLHHILRCKELLDRYIAGESYETCLIPTDRDYLISIKATYRYSLDEAKALAKEAVDYVKAKKQSYLETMPRKVFNEVDDRMNNILVQVLTKAWIGQ